MSGKETFEATTGAAAVPEANAAKADRVSIATPMLRQPEAEAMTQRLLSHRALVAGIVYLEKRVGSV